MNKKIIFFVIFFSFFLMSNVKGYEELFEEEYIISPGNWDKNNFLVRSGNGIELNPYTISNWSFTSDVRQVGIAELTNYTLFTENLVLSQELFVRKSMYLSIINNEITTDNFLVSGTDYGNSQFRDNGFINISNNLLSSVRFEYSFNLTFSNNRILGLQSPIRFFDCYNITVENNILSLDYVLPHSSFEFYSGGYSDNYLIDPGNYAD